MSLIKFLITPKKKMVADKAPRTKVGRFTLSTHSQKRMVERSIKKGQVIHHLYHKPLHIIPKEEEPDGSYTYKRIGKKITTVVAAKDSLVRTMYPTGSRIRRKFSKRRKHNEKKARKRGR